MDPVTGVGAGAGAGAARALPEGTVTFLFTDVEGSTRLWEAHPAAMGAALARHDALIEALVAAHGGAVVRPRGEGDSRFGVFARATDAVAAAAAVQRALHAEPWPPQTPLRVRLALHTGEADLRAGDYYGSAVNRAARLRAVAHGGQAVLSQATQDLVRDGLPEGVALRDLGAHRLSDLARPERVFQLLHPALPAAFPPLRSLDARPHNLPVPPTPLVGREAEVAAVRARLLDPAVRLLTLTGPGGVGKTRLALQAAGEVAGAAPDGVWFVPLAPVADPELLAPAVARALGVQEAPGRPVQEAVAAHLRPKRLLLVLDNFEHLLAAAPAVAALLAAGAGVQALVTSRAVLRLAGEHAVEVPPLGLPGPRDEADPERLGRAEAVRLFVARARAAAPGFALTKETAPAVAAICRRLDGLPLALELAAARLRLLPPAALLARLERRLPLLTAGTRDAPARHQTLRGAIAWSEDLLGAGERVLFRRLGVFAGGCTLEAAEAVCVAARAPDEAGDPGGDVLDGLAALVDHSLLRQEAAPAADGDTADESRLGMLETVREYARERLEASGEADAVRGHHAAYFLALAEAAEPALAGPTQGAWLDRLEVEHDNLRAAWRWYADAGAGAEGVRLGAALWQFWHARGHFTEGQKRLGEVLAASREQPDEAGRPYRAKALRGAGALAAAQGDYAAARRLYEESLAAPLKQSDRRGAALALNALGNVAFYQGDYAAARRLYEESLAALREQGDRRGAALALNALGNVAFYQGDYAAARRLYEEGLAALREQGDRRGAAYPLNNLGLLATDRGDHAAASAALQESLAIRRELGDRRGVAVTLNNLGLLATDRGDHAAASAALQESLAIRRELGDKDGMVWSLVGLVGLAAAQRRSAHALRLAGATAALVNTLGSAAPRLLRERLQRSVADAQRNVTEAAATEAWAQGSAMSVDEAIASALFTENESKRQAPLAFSTENMKQDMVISDLRCGRIRIQMCT